MNIAILGWGSLLYKSGDMLLEGEWKSDGPVLKIEFSRISADGRLTLVVDPEHGADVKTYYVKSGRAQLNDAICDLMIREGASRESIGYCQKQDAENRKCNQPKILEWLHASEFDAAIWTNLATNFRDKREVDFSVENAFGYLESLSPVCMANARDYIIKAPEQTQTPLRQYLQSKNWL